MRKGDQCSAGNASEAKAQTIELKSDWLEGHSRCAIMREGQVRRWMTFLNGHRAGQTYIVQRRSGGHEQLAGQKHGESKVVGAREETPRKDPVGIGGRSVEGKISNSEDAIWPKLDDWILHCILKINWF